jgi:hypothetical protein
MNPNIPQKPILLSPTPLSDQQLDCIDKLAQCLEEAKKGNVFTVGIVVCMKMGFATTIGGTDAGSLNLGCDALKQRILENVVDEGRIKVGSVGIIRGKQ